MKKYISKFSVVLSFILVFQLFNPLLNIFASELVGIPTNVIVNVTNILDISIKWDAVTGAQSYKIYKLNGENKELYGQSSRNSLSKTGVAEGSYTLAVSAIKDGIESDLSSSINFEINYPEIKSPQNLTYQIFNINDVQLKWDSVPYANSYKIYQIIDNQKKLVATTSTTSRNLVGVAEGEYTYEISAFHGIFGESINNNRIIVSVAFPKLKAPEGITYSITNGNDLQLSWQSVEYATRYNIYQIINNERRLIATSTFRNKEIPNLVEGEYIFEVSATNGLFGESIENNQIKVLIVFPELEAPKGLTYTPYNAIDLKLSWQPVQYATGYNIYEIISNEKKLIATSTNTSKILTNLSTGEHVFKVTSFSEHFGESKDSTSLTAVISYPEVKAPAVLTASLDGGKGINLKWSVAEYANYYIVYEVIDGEKIKLGETEGIFFSLPEVTEGMHIYEVSSVSNQFGDSVDTTSTFIDVIFPKLLAPIAQINISDNNVVNLNWSHVDFANSYNVYKIVNNDLILLDNVESRAYLIDGLSEGQYEFAIKAINNIFGESPLSNIVTAYIKPLLEAPITETPEVIGDEVELDWSPVPGADSYNIYKVEDGKLTLVENTIDTNLTIDDLPPGDNEFRIIPVSPTGVESENYSTVVVEVEQSDTTPPQTVANENEEWVNGEYKVVLTATDDQSGVAKTFYSINGSQYVEGTMFTVSTDGIQVVSFYSVDNAGNEETPKTTVIKVDKTPPVTVSDVTENWSKDDVTVNLTATDDLSGVVKTFYSFNGTDFVEGTSFIVNKEGIQTVYFYSVDNAGNIESTKTAEVKIDKTAPETVSDVTDKWNKGEVTVNLTATDNLSGVDKTFYSLNGIDFEEGTSIKVNEQGVNTVYFYSVDNAGNVEEIKTAQVKIDNTAPETVSDVIDQWNKGEVSVSLTATDDLSGVAKTFYSLNGSDFVEGNSFTVNEEGTKTVYFYSVDNAGNVEEVKSAQVKIDKTAPETVSDVTDKWNKGEVTVNLTATDNLSGVAKTFYSLKGTDFVEGTSFTVNEEGVNTVFFYSVDNAGNVEEVKTAEVKIDKTAPTASWNLDKEYALGVSLPLNYQASDELSGIAEESVTVNGQAYQKGDSVKLDQPGTYNIVVKVIDNAGNSTTIEKTFVVYIPGNLVVNPGVIKANTGDFTVKITLPTGFNTNQIDLSTATLNGVSAKSGTNGLVQQAKNGQFKFNRDDFKWSKGKVLVEFRVLVNGQLVVGSTYVEVK
jgi:large repetitive protein